VTAFLRSLRGEWLKRRRSLVSWLIFGSAFFVPAIILAARLHRPDQLSAVYEADGFWEKLWTAAWESMTILILPMVIPLVVSLITQIEYRNNTWKQVHASPQALATIFLAKLTVILIVVAELFLLFNVAIYLTGVLPALLFREVPLPVSPIPFRLFLDRDLRYLVDCLPIVAVQYMLALRFRSFVAPLGIGMALWVLSVGTLSTPYNYFVPYSYCGMDYLVDEGYRVFPNLPASPSALAAGCFALFTLAAYLAYALKADKG
jgi:lantibiotic transport system permease protein